MSVNMLKRGIESSIGGELYLTVVPTAGSNADELAEEAFTAISDALTSTGARILQEKVFGTREGLKTAHKVRCRTNRSDDTVPPSYLVCTEGASGAIAGVQVHAVSTDEPLGIVSVDGTPCGRVLRSDKSLFLTLSNLSDNASPSPTHQARQILKKAETTLKRYGGSFTSVPRTWMWLGDILSWYDDFNRVRNDFFSHIGAIGNGKPSRMPASTGIGLQPGNGCKCSMDLAAVIGPDSKIDYLQTTQKQKSAFEYGSAFSRAASAATPAGRTVYISGTASIDASGRTTNVDDPEAQIRETIENVRTALHDMGCQENDFVQLTAYAKSTDVERIFNSLPESKSWPALTMVCDICRPDLLFEIEATAMKPQR
jgi:enamine deaminase RidA (YjgF/YER057c/UK114 family)